MTDKAVHGFVSGAVQMVGFRQTCRGVARSLGLAGWVRNLNDGRVEVFAQGPVEAVDQLVDWMWDGPGHARVTGVETDVVALDPLLADFLIQPNQRR